MAKIKPAKSAVDAAQPRAQAIELRQHRGVALHAAARGVDALMTAGYREAR